MAHQWWEPGTPIYCKLVNRGNTEAKVQRGHPVARMIAVNTRDPERFKSLFDSRPSTVDQGAPSAQVPHVETSIGERVSAQKANCGQLSVQQKHQLENLLEHFISGGLFPTDPKRVPACVDGELTLPLANETSTPAADKQRRFSPEEVSMIRAEISKLLDRGIIRPSKSPWAAQVLCVRKKDGTMRLCVDWRRLNARLIVDGGGLGDMQSIFSSLKGKRYFTQIDLASGFHQMPIAEKDKHKTAFRDADGRLWEFNRAGFGLTVLPAAFTRVVKTALEPPEDDVVSWLDDILVSSRTWEAHINLLRTVFQKLVNARLSVNFAKCNFAAPSQEYLGMVVDSTGIRPAPSKLEAVINMPRPTNVEELRAFLGLTGYLRQFVEKHSIIAAPLTNILRNKDFASKRARKSVIPWEQDQEQAFVQLKQALTSPKDLAFPDWGTPSPYTQTQAPQGPEPP